MSSELRDCQICPRHCGIDRYTQRGFCGAGAELKLNLVQLHRGEEPPLSGSQGSGTIFFSHCNLKCVFCQNYSISCEGFGRSVSEAELLQMMLDLQDQGAHNINLVTPTHYSIQLISAIKTAKAANLHIPIIWNSSAYENVETLAQLETLVDIYLPDYKYYHGIYAQKYSQAKDYPSVAFKALQEMYRQVGPLQLDSSGLAHKGMLLRLLVLPNALAGTCFSLRKIADTLGSELPISLMAQYYPASLASSYPELNRGITKLEYQKVLDSARELGFSCIYAQELSCNDEWTPRFSRDG